MLRRWWALVLGAGLVVWSGTLDNSFHYDDEHSIVDNIYLRVTDLDASVIGTYFAEPGTFSVDAEKGMYRPLLVTSYALNYATGEWLGLGGYHVGGYHAVNIALHLAGALIVCWLTGLLGGSAGARLLAGLLFVLHPVASEPVNYISSRSESLSVMLYLLGVALFLRGESGGGLWRWGVWAAMAAGLLSKSTTITLPAVLLLLDVLVISGRDLRRVASRLLSHHLGGWIVAIAYLAIVTANGWLGRSLAQDVRAPWAQALTQVKAAVYYMVLLAAPVHQSVEPQFAVQSTFGTVVAGPLLLLASLAVGALWLSRSGHWRALFLLCWACVHLLPTLVVPLNVLVNERRAYGPLAILCIGAGILLASVHWRQLGWPRRPGWGLAVAGCAVLGVLSAERSRVWADEFSLWGDAVRKAPRMSRAHLYLGNAYKDAAQHATDLAVRSRHWQAATDAYAVAFEEARDLDLRLRALNNRGGVHMSMAGEAHAENRARKEYAAAEELFKAAVEQNPLYADAIINLGSVALLASRQRGRTQQEKTRLLRQSIERYLEALRVRPNHSQAHGNLGVAYQDLGELDEAARHYRHAVHLNPGDWLTLKNLGNVLYDQASTDLEDGRTEVAGDRLAEGRIFVLQALRLNPAVPNGRQVLKAIEARLQALRGGG
jgi:tetratricopeptide (TPR) repeat protein